MTDYTVAVTATNANGIASATATATVVDAWINTAVAALTGSFEWKFDAVPTLSPGDIVVGLSNGLASDYTNLAVIVRFSPAGVIDVRNGAVYAALANVPYVANGLYHFRVDVNISTHTYSVFVTPDTKTEITLATNAAFRTEQATVAVLNNVAVFGTSGMVLLYRQSFLGSVNPADPWINLDGRLNAPVGVTPLPTLLNTYHPGGTSDGRYFLGTGGGYQPPWHVAGVDYPVGHPTNITLKVPLVSWTGPGDGVGFPLGCTNLLLGGANYCEVNANGTIIDGWDFSQDGGWQVDVNVSNVTIQNCNFLYQATASTPIFFEGGSGGTNVVQYCTINGANDGTNNVRSINESGLIRALMGSGTLICRYNYLFNAYSDMIDMGNSTAGVNQAVIMQYNLFLNGGMGTDGSGHPDFFQMAFNNLTGWNVSFNTIAQTLEPKQGGNQGFATGSTAGGGPFTISCICNFTNNTAIALAAALNGEPTGGGLFWAVNVANNQFAAGGGATITNNFGDTTGMKGPNNPTTPIFIQFNLTPTTENYSNNTRMTTGATMTLSGSNVF